MGRRSKACPAREREGGQTVLERNRALARRMVEGINAGDVEGTVDELFAPRAARRVKRLFAEFYSAFPDWREEIVELVAEGNTEVPLELATLLPRQGAENVGVFELCEAFVLRRAHLGTAASRESK